VSSAALHKIALFLAAALLIGFIALAAFTASSELMFPKSEAALIASASALLLFLLVTSPVSASLSHNEKLALFTATIVMGVAIRLFLAFTTAGNFDMRSYEIVLEHVRNGENVYTATHRYNYSPVWFHLLGALGAASDFSPALPFPAIIRLFLTIIDLNIVAVLIVLAHQEARSPLPAVVFFFANPASFLLTGYHGQFENIALLILLTGIALYNHTQARSGVSTLILWISATFATVVKHNVVYEILIFLNQRIRSLWLKLLLLGISGGVFAMTFAPYWQGASESILRNVFLYGGLQGSYGISAFVQGWSWRLLFLVALFVYPLLLRSRDLVRNSLLGALFFLSFTTGISDQYFVLPIVFGALRPSSGFFVYTLAASLFLLSSDVNVDVEFLNGLSWNIVWVAALYWFFTVQFRPSLREN
jgi:hypothetical protein